MLLAIVKVVCKEKLRLSVSLGQVYTSAFYLTETMIFKVETFEARGHCTFRRMLCACPLIPTEI